MDERRQAFGEHCFHLIAGKGTGNKDVLQYLLRHAVAPRCTPCKFRQTIEVKPVAPIHQRDRYTVQQCMTCREQREPEDTAAAVQTIELTRRRCTKLFNKHCTLHSYPAIVIPNTIRHICRVVKTQYNKYVVLIC